MFDYFAYGSNLDRAALRAKGVTPVAAGPGVLTGWRLRFNVAHFFRHEGGVANIEPTGDAGDRVLGVVHILEADDLARLDAAEAYPDGYDRTTVPVETARGVVNAVAYTGTAAFIDDSCLPSQRYLTIVVRGASDAGLDAAYVEQLRRHRVLEPRSDPPFEHPEGDYPSFTLETLAAHAGYTALDGAVFDMTNARAEHQLLRPMYGGRDMTAYHLRRLDTSDGTDTATDPAATDPAARTPAQQAYLNTFLRSYAEEYTYRGRLDYEP